MSGSDRTVSVDLDERGRIPFAVIGVLVLLSSVMVVATLENRTESQVQQDGTLAMDRAVSAAQGELRTATLEASYRAGTAPISSAAGSEADAIADADSRTERFENYVKLLVYLEAVETLPHAGTEVRNAEVSVSLSPVTASGSQNSIDPDRAIERVDLEIGHFEDGLEQGTITATVSDVRFHTSTDEDTPTEQRRSITVSVGTPVFELYDQLEEYESQLNSDFFEESIDSEMDGLGQHLGARLYPFAYFKSGWDRMQPTRSPADHDFEEVIDVKHTEVLVNHAIFAVQNDVFGTQDPYAERSMRPGFVCLAAQMGNDMSGASGSGSEPIVDEDAVEIDDDAESVSEDDLVDDIEGQLCDGGAVQEWLFSDEATGELPETPELSELVLGGLGEMDVMDDSEEVPLEDVATASYLEHSSESAEDVVGWFEEQTSEAIASGELAGESEIDDDDVPDGADEYERNVRALAEELYQVDLERETESVRVSGTRPSVSPPADERNYTKTDDTTRIDELSAIDVDHETFERGEDADRTLHEIDLAADIELERTQTWESDDPENVTPATKTKRGERTISLESEIEIDGAYGFDRSGGYYDRDSFTVEERPLEYDYEPDDEGRPTFERAFEDAVPALTTADSNETVSADFAAALEGLENERIESVSTVETEAEDWLLEGSGSTTLELDDLTDDDGAALVSTLQDDLARTHDDLGTAIEAEPFEVDRVEMLETPTPPERAIDHLQEEYEDEYVYDGLEGERYGTPEERLRAQMRLAYFDRIYYWLERTAEPYEDSLDEMGDHVDDAGGDGMDALDDVLGFTQDALNADVAYDPDDIEGSPVLEDAQFEVSGSPTYLPKEPISEDRDPAIRPPEASITDVDGETDHASLAIHTDNRVGWPGLPLIPFPPSLYLGQLNSWHVDVRGEYARFEASATVGDASSGDRLTVVREHRPIELELSDGETVFVGANEPIDFESSLEVIVMMPGGVLGSGGLPSVADPGDPGEPLDHCSDTWDFVGPDYDTDAGEGC